MTTHKIKPGFELIFALSIICIMTLPLLVFAQGNKNMDITIINGDTTVNGKNIKNLSADERKQAMKDIDNLSGPETHGRQRIVFKRRSMTDTGAKNMVYKRHFFNHDDLTEDRRFFNDSTKHVFKFRMKRPDGDDSTFTFDYKLEKPDDALGLIMPDEPFREFRYRMREPEEGFRHRNVQRFDYTNTGNDGISTHTSFRLSDASPEKTKNITGSEKTQLELRDLNLVPEFTSGKILLMFSLSAKTPAEVKLTDSEGKLIWSEKAANGQFSKSFPLGLNGVYFLEVKQGGKIALKRVVKEE
ncbi:T9SS type A sorting domain-containing protein [Mucilaginibacter sp. BT774]|uniref:T9SS type A sorting domain-containing protein n=1 Tax=Mucilaginibacter sp. BT774 TaxID=3062276 RepID=UPI0026757011|nr:T9SS type A sorting domain-containing protein [Mucilaginibacter sp. BT774]MDO3627228.1 T9SS type A sorting domain-containing protein [Mucilaginibacter sp. BT774]